MKYTATIYGYGGELHIGSVPKKVWDYFSNFGDLGSYLNGDEDAPDDIAMSLPREELHEVDNVEHRFGPFFRKGTFMEVRDDKNEEIFLGEFGEESDEDMFEIHAFSEDAIDIYNIPHDYVFVGLDAQKGAYNDYVIETEEKFDPDKLLVQIKHITDNSGYDVFLIEEVLYDNVVVEPSGDHDTMGKSADYRLYDIKNKEAITTEDD